MFADCYTSNQSHIKGIPRSITFSLVPKILTCITITMTSQRADTVTAWAIAVTTIPILENLHEESRVWKKDYEKPIPEFLYFDVLLQAQQPNLVNSTLHHVVCQIHRRAEWILQRVSLESWPNTSHLTDLDILSHLYSPRFFDWMAAKFWEGEEEVDQDIALGCSPVYCNGLHDNADWIEQCPRNPQCVNRYNGEYAGCTFYECDWCGWHNTQVCLTCFDGLLSSHSALPLTVRKEIQWIHDLLKQGVTSLVSHIPELSQRALRGNTKSCVQSERIFALKYPYEKNIMTLTQNSQPKKYSRKPFCCPRKTSPRPDC